jgi:hypothetical protein
MVLSAMLKGYIRSYPFIFSYIIVNLLSTVVQFSTKYYFGERSREFAMAYWVSDFAGTLLLLLIIIHLVRMAMTGHKHQLTVYWGLLLGAAVIGVASYFKIHSMGLSSKAIPRLMTTLGRDYYFSAVILNLMLWVALVRTNHPNKQLYLLTSGQGLQLSGAAVAHALRGAGREYWFVANVFLITTYLANLIVWYVALKRFPVAIPLASEEINKASARGA